MTIAQAVKIIARHNRWRRCARIKMVDPIYLGRALDKVCSHWEETLTHVAKVKRPRRRP